MRKHTVEKRELLIVGNTHSNPSTKAFLDKFVRIILATSIPSRIYVISGDVPLISKLYWLKTKDSVKGITYYLSWIDSLAKTLKVALTSRIRGAIVLVTPMLLHIMLLKIFSVRVAIFVAQRPSTIVDFMLSKLSIFLADFVIVEAPSALMEWGIKCYHKVLLGGLYVDTHKFKRYKGFEERELALGYLGILDYRKGVDRLLRVFYHLLRIEPRAKLFIAGFGPLASIIKEIANHNKNIVYIGSLRDNELSDFYNKICAFILLSRSEGLPNVVLESMACGTPVIATPVGAIPDIVNDKLTGLIIYPNDDLMRVAFRIKEALTDPRLWENFSKNCQKRARAFTFNRAVNRYKSILIRVLK
jgi:glycosyltransferase involved in cell wall biosynthesis